MIHTTYYKSDQMLVLSGDHLYRMDYAKLIRNHRESKAEVTLCVYPVTREEVSRMGLLKVDKKGEVEEFVEKPQDPKVIDRFRAPDRLLGTDGPEIGSERCLASMGVYVFEPEILHDMLSQQNQTDFGKEIIPAAIGKRRVMAYPFTDYWLDIGF